MQFALQVCDSSCLSKYLTASTPRISYADTMSGGQAYSRNNNVDKAFDFLDSNEKFLIKHMKEENDPNVVHEAKKKKSGLRADVLMAMKMPRNLVNNPQVKEIFDNLAEVEIKLANKRSLTPEQVGGLWCDKMRMQGMLEATCKTLMAGPATDGAGPIKDKPAEGGSGAAPVHDGSVAILVQEEEALPVAAEGAPVKVGPIFTRAQKKKALAVAAGAAPADDIPSPKRARKEKPAATGDVPATEQAPKGNPAAIPAGGASVRDDIVDLTLDDA